MMKRAFVTAGLSILVVAACAVAPREEPEVTVTVAREALASCGGDTCFAGQSCCGGVCTPIHGRCGAGCEICETNQTCTSNHCCAIGKVWCGSSCVAPCDCPPSVDDWLAAHPNVANAIKWQYRNTTGNGYTPIEADKVAYPSWDAGMKQLLRTSFEARYTALCRAVPYTETLLDPPNNVFNGVNNYFNPPYTDFTFAHSRDLYVAHVAHSLAIEIGRFVPWSITTYDAASLAILVDSASMMARELAQHGTRYAIGGAFSPYAHPHRDLNRGWTIPAPPSIAYRFMRGQGPGATQNLVSRTRYATIVNLMQWSRDSMDHFYGPKTYVNFELTWGYHGLPPVTRILSGTTSASPDRDPADPPFQHWTAGCGGTAGFFRDVLRTVNIPVVVPRVCGHHQIYFPTEGRYLDHGDAPYSGYGSATFPVRDLLIDESAYVAFYGTNLHNEAQNEPDDSVHCKNVGRHTDELLAGAP